MSKNILLKKHNGTGWDVLHPITKAKNVMSSDGGTVQDHIGAGGTAHASATGSQAGFMPPEDKAALDAATSAATASTLAKRDTAGRLKAAAPAAADDVARKNETDAAMTAAATASGAAATAQSRADAAYNRADAAFTQASEGKTVVAAAITGKGVPASNSDTFPQLATKINSIQLATGNATAADVLVGRSFSTPAAGTGAVGTMPDNVNNVVQPSALGNVAIPYGRHSGSVVAAVQVNTAALLSGFSVAGAAGTMPSHGSPEWNPTTFNQYLPAGYFGGGVVYGSPNLAADNIRDGVDIFGVVGNVQAKQTANGSFPTKAVDNANQASWVNTVQLSFIPTAYACYLTGGSFPCKSFYVGGISVTTTATGTGAAPNGGIFFYPETMTLSLSFWALGNNQSYSATWYAIG